MYGSIYQNEIFQSSTDFHNNAISSPSNVESVACGEPADVFEDAPTDVSDDSNDSSFDMMNKEPTDYAGGQTLAKIVGLRFVDASRQGSSLTHVNQKAWEYLSRSTVTVDLKQRLLKQTMNLIHTHENEMDESMTKSDLDKVIGTWWGQSGMKLELSKNKCDWFDNMNDIEHQLNNVALITMVKM